MSEKLSKAIRRAGQKEFNRHARKAILLHVDRLATEPFRVRLAYAWRFIRGRNPHTNKKVVKK